jgi:hypothetical protein
MSLTQWEPSKEVVDRIVGHCPNLRYLYLVCEKLDEKELTLLVGSIKSGFASICLGTELKGYERLGI